MSWKKYISVFRVWGWCIISVEAGYVYQQASFIRLNAEMWKIRCKKKPKTITCRNLNTFVFLFAPAPPQLDRWLLLPMPGFPGVFLLFKGRLSFFSPGYCSVFTLKSKAPLWQLLLWFGLIYWWTWIECYLVFGTSACGFSVHLQTL